MSVLVCVCACVCVCVCVCLCVCARGCEGGLVWQCGWVVCIGEGCFGVR